MKYTFIDLAKDVLESASQPLSASEVWDKAVETGLDKKVSSAGKTPKDTLAARMYCDTKYNGESSIFVRISNRPVLFTLREKPNFDIAKIKEKSEKTTSFKERDLHKILASFVYSSPHFSCHTTTIRHEKSLRKIKGQNSWLHPDIVGVRFPFNDYEKLTWQLMKSISFSTCKLFSFEMKIAINFTNLRECYFQSVSNSSWANEGYLVALKYDQDPEFRDEMRRLNNAFGIGFIQLNAEDYFQSEIILSAKYNESLDWNTIDRLIEDNEDFRSFADAIEMSLRNDQLCKQGNFDVTFANIEEFAGYVKDKEIAI
jgi:hypothetical protein